MHRRTAQPHLWFKFFYLLTFFEHMLLLFISASVYCLKSVHKCTLPPDQTAWPDLNYSCLFLFSSPVGCSPTG